MSLLKYFKLFFSFFTKIITFIRDLLLMILNFFTGSISLIKGTIDFIYKLLFIAFFCVIAYICYQVFTSASVINKKLDELQSGITYIKQITEDFSKIAQKTTEASGNQKQNSTVSVDNLAKTASKITEKLKKFI